METLLCTSKSRMSIGANLAEFERATLETESFRRAAVAITIVDFRRDANLSDLKDAPADSCAVVLTKRASGLKNHAGQWAFPGGSIDPGESPTDTALRELEEEVGLDLSNGAIMGCLDDFVTRSGFHITPVVVWAGVTDNLVRNEQEVASIHRIPFKELFRSDAPVYEESISKEEPILFMPVGNTFIATPTAAILYQFREVAIAGRAIRVAHFEQPYFAWS